jgi:bifunctional enzyme CysN/CysC
MGVRQVVLAITKMDLIGYDRAAYDKIVADFVEIAGALDLPRLAAIPVSGVSGDNIASKSASTPWYDGPTLIQLLEGAEPREADRGDQPLRMSVQSVVRPNLDFRGFAGRISAGAVKPGDAIRILPSGRTAKIARIVTSDGDLPEAVAGQSVTLTLDHEVDCSRGDVVAAADAPCEIADQFQATIVWMSDTPLYPGRRYALKIGAVAAHATITDIRHGIDIETFEPSPAREIEANGIALCNVSIDRAIPFDPFSQSRELGGFILIDPDTNETAGAGLIHFALRRAHNVHWQALEVDREAHAAIKGQRPAILWFTGLSGAGKSTIANLVEKKLHAMGRHTVLLDGDNIRHGLNRDLGFTQADRVENIRRVAEVAKLMADAGLIVLVSFISPFRAERDLARNLARDGEFYEIFIDVPLAVAEARDVKGLYKKARAGELKNFTGIDSPYEPPEKAEIRIDAAVMSPADAAEKIVAAIGSASGRS